MHLKRQQMDAPEAPTEIASVGSQWRRIPVDWRGGRESGREREQGGSGSRSGLSFFLRTARVKVSLIESVYRNCIEHWLVGLQARYAIETDCGRRRRRKSSFETGGGEGGEGGGGEEDVVVEALVAGTATVCLHATNTLLTNSLCTLAIPSPFPRMIHFSRFLIFDMCAFMLCAPATAAQSSAASSLLPLTYRTPFPYNASRQG